MDDLVTLSQDTALDTRALPVYLDCNATTPIDARVREVVLHFLDTEFGNAGSRTHERGNRAKQAVQRSREKVATIVGAEPDEVTFTSGATESDNLAILGLARGPAGRDRRHIISTQIEHKAVLEPLEVLAKEGFEVELLPVDASGAIRSEAVAERLRDDTLLVSVMHVNNETGVVQPIDAIASILGDHPAYFHVDAAQSFGKMLDPLRNRRVELISISGHKIYAPKGIGALVARRRRFDRPPLVPLMYGGGQERGLRPGTQPVHLIAGLGAAAELALSESENWARQNAAFRTRLLSALEPLSPVINGDPKQSSPNSINFSLPGIDAEAAMVALKGIIEVSNGSACTSQKYEPSHVLKAMGLDDDRIAGALRLSWCHLTEEPDWARVVGALAGVATS